MTRVSPLTRNLALSLLGSTLVCSSVQAEFLKDSKANLMIRNYYYNRDFRQDNAAQSHADEWAQGFWLKYESGFTEGPVGFGLDATAMWGIRLDSSPGRAGTGLLPVHNDGDVPNDYGKAGGTAKMRIGKSVFRYGTLFPMMPTLTPNQTRLFPQYFRGMGVESNDIDNLMVRAGRLTDNVQRNSTAGKEITMTNKGMKGGTPTDQFDYAGFKYQWSKTLSVGVDYANMDNNYHQTYFTLNHTLPIADGHSFSSDVRYARSADDGQSNVDNKAINGMFVYKMKAHTFGLGLQKMIGDTGFAYITGSDPYLVNFAQVNDFANPGEKSWQARYTYDFAAMGIPGLSLMTRYISGTDIRRADGSKGEEWERDTYIDYAFQNGPLKNLVLQWRNATLRNDGRGNDLDENRVIVTYNLPLL
jgi:outer membrane porin, OprD family